MPPPIPSIYGVDTCSGFEQAAQQRFQEGDALRNASFHGGAIYHYGYVVEMLLKAACYRLFGLGPHTPVDDSRLILEEWIAEFVFLNPKKKLRPHDLDAWAKGLLYYRTNIGGHAYLAAFSLTLGTNVNVVLQYWVPSMRYHHLPWSNLKSTDVRDAAR